MGGGLKGRGMGAGVSWASKRSRACSANECEKCGGRGASVAGVAGWLLAQPVAQRGLELRSLTFEGHRSTMLSDLE